MRVRGADTRRHRLLSYAPLLPRRDAAACALLRCARDVPLYLRLISLRHFAALGLHVEVVDLLKVQSFAQRREQRGVRNVGHVDVDRAAHSEGRKVESGQTANAVDMVEYAEAELSDGLGANDKFAGRED